jgi:hypothetical protein
MKHMRDSVFRSVLIAFALMAAGFISAPVDAASSDIYSTVATLGDGVDGLDLNRTMTVKSQVWAIESVDDLMLVGGAFTHVRDRSTFTQIPRAYLAGFDPTTGEYVPWFATQPNGPVYDIEDLGDGRVLLAGEFSSVNGVPGTEGIAVIDVSTGMVDTKYSVTMHAGNEPVVRAIAVHGGYVYLTGSFSSLSAGGVGAGTGSVARINLATGKLDSGFKPKLIGGGGWAIDVANDGTVFVGGLFDSVNNVNDTEILVALAPDGTLKPGWSHGFPHSKCAAGTFSSCGSVTGIGIVNDRLFVTGAKHFWAALDVATGDVLVDRVISNDGQSIDIVDGMVVLGCHCATPTASDEFDGIPDRYIRVIDPVTLSEVESPTLNTKGAAGGWASAGAPDGCLWVGGNFSNTTIGSQKPAWNLLRFCPNSATGSNPPLALSASADLTSPMTPAAPTILDQRGSTVAIAWAASADDSGQVVYNVFRNGQLVARTSGLTFNDPLLGENTTFQWQVSAMDLASNMSPTSPLSAPVRIGERYNVAPAGIATQSSNSSPQSLAAKATDGNTDGLLANGSVSRTSAALPGSHSWWNLDLGEIVDVDYVEVFPRSDEFAETNDRLRVFSDTKTITGTTLSDASSGGHSVWVGDRLGQAPEVEVANLSSPVRYLRLFNSSPIVAFAEVRVYTVDRQIPPAPPTRDSVAPSASLWRKVQSRGQNSVLSWGGAQDDRAVAYYEIYRGGSLLARTTHTSYPFGQAGQSSSGLEIVTFDAARNNSPLPAGLTLHPASNSAAFVSQQFRDFLGREPNPNELAARTAELDAGQLSKADLVAALASAYEHTDAVYPNIRLYQAYFGRLPDAGGLRYWVSLRRAGVSVDSVSDQFALSAEFANTYGDTGDAEFIRLVYENVLGRQLDPGGFSYWLDLLSRRAITRGQLMIYFSESLENKTNFAARVQVVGAYGGLLYRMPTNSELSLAEASLNNAGPTGLLVGLLASNEYEQRFR